jgi:hypothetical protein
MCCLFSKAGKVLYDLARHDIVTMRKDNLLHKIIKRLKAIKQSSLSKRDAQSTDAVMGKLLAMIDDTDDVELTCDEVFALLDHYVELEACGEDAASVLPLVKKHLDRCHDCLEEYEALALILEASPLDGS